MKRVLKLIAFVILTPIVLVAVYLLAAVILSRLSVAKQATANSNIPLYILTNGVHTDLVLPVRTSQIDWSKQIPYANTTGKDTTASLIAFGWGDKGFYLETPTWADLKFSTAFKAAFGLSSAVVHTTYYHHLQEDNDCVKMMIDSAQYAHLVTFIEASFKTDNNGLPIYIHTNANYDNNDAFYEAKGSYSLFHTCNTWANNGLKAGGQKACWWTPFDKGIFYQYGK
jgi:uncharacterized protein (TIGR02117 family)